jgi:hypothetical protein
MLPRERLSPETRLKTGWLIPAAAGAAAQIFAPGPEVLVARRDQLVFAAFLAAGLLVGLLWQWYSPRSVGDRLVWPALCTVMAAFLFALPGELVFRPALLLCGVGIIAGVVLTNLRQTARGHSRDGSSSA